MNVVNEDEAMPRKFFIKKVRFIRMKTKGVKFLLKSVLGIRTQTLSTN